MNLLPDVVILVSKTHKEARALARRFGEDPPQEGCMGAAASSTKNGKFHARVYIDSKLNKDPLELADTIAHEAVHVFRQYCMFINEPEPSKEFEAYGVGSIVKEVTRQWRDKR